MRCSDLKNHTGCLRQLLQLSVVEYKSLSIEKILQIEKRCACTFRISLETHLGLLCRLLSQIISKTMISKIVFKSLLWPNPINQIGASNLKVKNLAFKVTHILTS